MAAANAANLIKDVGEGGVEAPLLANGAAVEALVPGNEVIAGLAELSGKGVEILACRNSLRSLGMAEEALPGFVRVVPAGITELVRRQQERWAYVKP